MAYVRSSRDGNHVGIVRALEAAGCYVVDLSRAGNGVADIIVRHPFARRSRFMEIKSAKGRMSQAQLLFRERFDVAIVRTPAEALEAIGLHVISEANHVG